MTITLTFWVFGVGLACVAGYILLVFFAAATSKPSRRRLAVAAAAAPPPRARPEDVAPITSLLENVLNDEKVEMADWANARWSVADPNLDQKVRRAWNLLGDWTRSEELLKRHPEIAEKIKADFAILLHEINDEVAPPMVSSAGAMPPAIELDQPA